MPESCGNRYIIVAVDHYSKYAFAQAVERVNGNTTSRFMKEVLNKHGPWKSITMDNAKAFKGKVFSQLLKVWDIKSHPISPRHPEANGSAERFVRTLRQLLRKNASATNWSQTLPFVLSAYNKAKHSATSATPIEVFLSTPAKFPIDKSHGVDVTTVRSPTGLNTYRSSYAKMATNWKPGSEVWHIPRPPNKLKSGFSHFEKTKFGPYIIVGPDQKKQQYLTVTDGHAQWSLPYWELIV
jgi:hypothetical protein